MNKLQTSLTILLKSKEDFSARVLSLFMIKDFPALVKVWEEIENMVPSSQLLIVDDLAVSSKLNFIKMVFALVNAGTVVGLVYDSPEKLHEFANEFQQWKDMRYSLELSEKQKQGKLFVFYVEADTKAIELKVFNMFANKYSDKE